MKQTSMQDLREDLQLTVETAKDALLEIENQEIREACQEVVRLTLNNIIKRIDEELLEMERRQIMDAYIDCKRQYVIQENCFPQQFVVKEAEQYYKERWKDKTHSEIIIPKEEQKQHLIDMMKGDEELGLYDESREIKVEDIFNDEKREKVKRVILQHKVLQGLTLINPAHLEMTSNGHGEFPDGYKLTEKGIQYIIEQLNKE
jgi:hypothetical protein